MKTLGSVAEAGAGMFVVLGGGGGGGATSDDDGSPLATALTVTVKVDTPPVASVVGSRIAVKEDPSGLMIVVSGNVKVSPVEVAAGITVEEA